MEGEKGEKGTWEGGTWKERETWKEDWRLRNDTNNELVLTFSRLSPVASRGPGMQTIPAQSITVTLRRELERSESHPSSNCVKDKLV